MVLSDNDVGLSDTSNVLQTLRSACHNRGAWCRGGVKLTQNPMSDSLGKLPRKSGIFLLAGFVGGVPSLTAQKLTRS